MESLNKDQRLRDTIIWGDYSPDDYGGGIRRFSFMKLDQLEKLISNNFIELDQRQNWSPSTKEFYDFLKKNPQFTAHGYAVELKRNDYRVTIEGLECRVLCDEETIKSFKILCRNADSKSIDLKKPLLYSWWD
jgi:hypothetical protein